MIFILIKKYNVTCFQEIFPFIHLELKDLIVDLIFNYITLISNLTLKR